MEQVWAGTLNKMRVAPTGPVSYWLEDGAPGAGPDAARIAVTPLVGRPVEIRFLGHIHCTCCGVEVERAYDNGYCGDCFRTRADADVCMMKPHLCHHGDLENPCRDETFAVERCFQKHFLYASLTSDVKVGITRHTNIPSRWIDQGAVVATTLAALPSRRAVGEVEHALAAEFRDRTHWMKMLREKPDESLLDEAIDAIVSRMEALGLPGILAPEQRTRMRFDYPLLPDRPHKVRSCSLNKTAVVGGVLLGLKGQYWILDTGVINIRRHSGYEAAVWIG